MLLPPPSPRNVLVVAPDPARVAGTVRALHAQGHVVEVVRTRSRALEAFFEAGGHQLVFLGSDLDEAEASAIWRELRAVHEGLVIL